MSHIERRTDGSEYAVTDETGPGTCAVPVTTSRAEAIARLETGRAMDRAYEQIRNAQGRP